MFCSNCGKELPEKAVVCTGCGCLVNGDLLTCQAEEQTQKNGMAVAGFVCSFITPILGWIFGGIGLSRAAKRGGKGKNFSIAAIAIASANFILGLAIL